MVYSFTSGIWHSDERSGVVVKKALLVAVVSGLIASTVFIGPSSAHVTRIETTLTIHRLPSGRVDSGDRVLVSGKVKPNQCALGQKVTLFENSAGFGEDEVLGTDRVDGDGEYGIRFRPRSDMNVYTKVRPAVIVSNYQHSHTCSRDRSPQIHIEVS